MLFGIILDYLEARSAAVPTGSVSYVTLIALAALASTVASLNSKGDILPPPEVSEISTGTAAFEFLMRIGELTFFARSSGAAAASAAGAFVLDLRTEVAPPFGIGGFFCLGLIR